ncbi:hypothetical protein AGABI1DRAFT_107996 [Agaricus bisporus var. burnettii JB137-S8]|uniref:Nephrocystin 3-like N-terminal domain-containing protein n=1 Tax=Agaricus bisporus var. burnettii (strain JB137-S8 / ATCC MYA-4627 / FGSC 10392) TaxID=597362 RepID=K5VSM0_AGABU|nr:uncharacterized protein AGABI1DRAFT_107996 [Agaricus bisporus var. burnettii JB137-S8]EKM77454.1 hypothetical protein AGABI1DRAFT_107996 [Agaricus bisporus var. burnettii JB137-S8]
MTLGRIRDKLKAWIWGFFSSKEKIRFMPDGPQRHAGPGAFFNNVQRFTLHNPTMTAVHGNQYNTFTNAQGDHSVVAQMMGLLSKHIIRGAAHNSSARSPPPRCHPDTRIKLIARITAWFEGQTSLESLLWITGPAGVGKSAVVQTFAEYLAKFQLLGASVFISRPNKRDNPHGIFITIAYHLATRIEAYRHYIIERLSLDPELLSGDMQAQFIVFILEPFVGKKIGTGGKRWGILLDGLDELQGTDAQCEIIQIISTFVLEHPDAPLVWIIASRPESHISNTFDNDQVRRSYWSEHIPIDSTEASEDVEHFLRSAFEVTRKKFRHSVQSDWPSDTDFLKLTAAASGLFIYAQVVMEFVRDSGHADPVSQFELLLSVIDRSNAVPTTENPFIHLDALYQEILSSIPSTLWRTTRQLLCFSIYYGRIDIGSFVLFELLPNLLTLRGMSIFFGVTQNVVYASLDKCRSILKIPDWKVAHKDRLTFLHASFSDYLKDSKRSGAFHVGNKEDAQQEVISSFLEVWNKCSGDDTSAASVELVWQQHCSKLNHKSMSWKAEKFHTILFHDTIFDIATIVPRLLLAPMSPPVYESLQKVHMRGFVNFASGFRDLPPNIYQPSGYVSGTKDVSPTALEKGLLREVQLRDLVFGHLDWKEMSPACARYQSSPSSDEPKALHRPSIMGNRPELGEV